MSNIEWRAEIRRFRKWLRRQRTSALKSIGLLRRVRMVSELPKIFRVVVGFDQVQVNLKKKI